LVAPVRGLWGAGCYRLDALPVVNSHPLAEHLRASHDLDVDGRLVLAPRIAVPRVMPVRRVDDVLRLVVYGRPSVGRNLFDTALRGIAMWEAERRARGRAAPLDIVSVGEPEQFRYRIGEQLVRTPGVLSWDAYLELLAGAHLGVSLMASPHPSYPPLEMAASGMVVVTNRWGPKDLGALSDRLVSCDPDAAAVARGLAEAEARHASGADLPLELSALGRPLEDVARHLREQLRSA